MINKQHDPVNHANFPFASPLAIVIDLTRLLVYQKVNYIDWNTGRERFADIYLLKANEEANQKKAV